MIAIIKHELRTYFHSLTSYIFGAFLLAIIGVGSLLYNIQASIANFEFVLGFSSIIFVVLVPILTMRVISEEKKQRTDQLLYSLPVTTTQVVLGKFIALLVVFTIPIAVIAVYPLIFSSFGNVCLSTAYGSLFAFYLTGVALIAMGIFISSLTDNQGLAAGIGIAAILLNYFSVSLAEHISSTPFGALIVFLALVFGLYVLIKALTKDQNVAFFVSLVAMVAVFGAFFLNPHNFEGLLPQIVSQLSLFKRLDTFVSGVFDLTAVTYFVTFSGLFIFLSVQSLEKKRYN